ncbi:Exocyst complex component 3 [Larimichthys crocea]|uniref:Uncharacterized protein n=1 Tax=Larimichthys crocea TaxID=215358 RepID=A0ACD3QRS0_LARCR|nr:Exocyst complex component 3 [Larimichthys crocea]
MWLVRLLEITRKYVLDDLIVVQNLMVQCFPPHYNTFNRFFGLYHNAVSSRVKELASEDLEANEIVSLLTWVLNTYKRYTLKHTPYLLSVYRDMHHFNMFEQNLQVAAQIDGDFKEQVLRLCLKQMNTFLIRESINSLKRKYSQSSEPTDSDAAIERTLNEVAKEGCQFLLDEVFLDLEHHLNELLTRKWLTGSHAVDTICVTVEDYFNDFNKIKKPFNQEMTSEALRRVVVEYIKAVMQKRITFKSADERREGAERMIKEADQFKFLFRKLAAGEDTDRLCGAIAAIAEVFKLTDPTLLFLEVTTLVSKYPDIREEHIQALLAVRGDASREMRQMIIGTLSENKVSYSGVTQPIFKDITVPTITMTTMTTMTSMATAKLLK